MERRKNSSFAVEKLDKYYLSQVIKVKINSNVMLLGVLLIWYVEHGTLPLWCSSPNPEVQYNQERKIRKRSQLRDIL